VFKTLVPDPGFPLQLVHHDDVVAALGGRPVRVPAVAATVV
jgi:hypothetical protein